MRLASTRFEAINVTDISIERVVVWWLYLNNINAGLNMCYTQVPLGITISNHLKLEILFIFLTTKKTLMNMLQVY